MSEAGASSKALCCAMRESERVVQSVSVVLSLLCCARVQVVCVQVQGGVDRYIWA